MVDVNYTVLPLWQAPALLLIPVLAASAGVLWFKRAAQNKSTSGEDPDWSVPSISDTRGDSFIHRWDVRCKIVTILVYCFIIASLSHLWPAVAAIGISLAILLIARVSWLKTARRLLAICGFVGMFLIVMPLSVPAHSGDTVFVFGAVNWLGFNLRGLHLAALIAAKATAITLLMEPLLSTAPLPVTLHGLSRLGAPEMAGQMVLLSYRYLHVFRHEARRMASGMQVRGFRRRTDLSTLQAVANFLGMLFVRSYERTERVFDAMRARGYKGRFPDPAELRLKAGDLWLAAGWMVVGSALIFYDRIIG
jgi:cobalt/nickel transport system permease protein